LEQNTRRYKNSHILVGVPSVGKTVVVEGLAQSIGRGKKDFENGKTDVRNLANARIFTLDMGALVAGAKSRGDFEERLKEVLKEVEEAEGRVIEIHLVPNSGRIEGIMDDPNLLKPMFDGGGYLRCTGTTTTEDNRKYVEKDATFERRFVQVDVVETSVPNVISMLHGIKEIYEDHHGVVIQDNATATQLSSRYIDGMFFCTLQLSIKEHTNYVSTRQLSCSNNIIVLNYNTMVILVYSMKHTNGM
jgi:ATP-dependent Clp protease ATP-binding subunit ClpB